jgi:glycosyltransferase involved in cell wall biosynthesis
MPSNIQISYCGSVAHDDVKGTIRANDVLFVPSRGENFGHIYLESLSAGVPILVSDQTPWRELESKGIGWDIPLSQPSSFTKAIENLARFTSRERLKLRLNCANYAKTMAEDPLSIELNRKVFTSALQSAKP